MKIIIVILILLFSVKAFFGQSDAEACRVFQAVLANEKPLVVLDSTISIKFGKHWAFSKRNPKIAVVQPKTLKSYQKSDYQCEIKDFVDFEPKKTLINVDEVISYFEKLKTDRDAAPAFYEKYGTDHFYTFSNVGFNKNKDQALLTIVWQSISFTGSDTYYVVLSKISGEWKIVSKEVIWSS